MVDEHFKAPLEVLSVQNQPVETFRADSAHESLSEPGGLPHRWYVAFAGVREQLFTDCSLQAVQSSCPAEGTLCHVSVASPGMRASQDGARFV